MSVLTLPI